MPEWIRADGTDKGGLLYEKKTCDQRHEVVFQCLHGYLHVNPQQSRAKALRSEPIWGW